MPAKISGRGRKEMPKNPCEIKTLTESMHNFFFICMIQTTFIPALLITSLNFVWFFFNYMYLTNECTMICNRSIIDKTFELISSKIINKKKKDRVIRNFEKVRYFGRYKCTLKKKNISFSKCGDMVPNFNSVIFQSVL